MAKRFGFLLCSILALWLSACSPAYMKHIAEYQFDQHISIPDYSKQDYWAALPFKKNPSDSIPRPLQSGSIKDSGVDVFFLHPTTFVAADQLGWNASIHDSLINARTDYSTILYQASAFNECRVFAPRYRQANIRSYFTPDSVRARQAFDTAYADIKTAFQYYLDHYNQNHPLIIASHSQGSTHALRLLKEFFENKPLQKKLIVAYIIGMAIPKNYFGSLGPCHDSLQTGCIVGWRTFKEGFEPGFVQKENGNSYICNPLTWTTTEEYAPKTLNKGAVLLKFNKVQQDLADAQIHDDVLWVHKPHFSGSIFYMTRNYHIGDINLFYMNIRQNIRSRIRAYRKS